MKPKCSSGNWGKIGSNIGFLLPKACCFDNQRDMPIIQYADKLLVDIAALKLTEMTFEQYDDNTLLNKVGVTTSSNSCNQQFHKKQSSNPFPMISHF